MDTESPAQPMVESTVLKDISNENSQKLQTSKDEASNLSSTMIPASDELRSADREGSVISDASSMVQNNTGNNTQNNMENNTENNMENNAQNNTQDNTENNSGLQSSLITEEMLAEEKKLHENTIRQEEQIKRQGDMMKGDSSEGRYEKLKFLLSKSQMYSTYLLNRMQKQKEENDRKRERREKKAAKEAERKAKEDKKSAEEDQGPEEAIERVKEIEETPETEAPMRRGLRTRADNSQSSQGSVTKGKKRKLDADSPKQVKIADFFTPKNKRRKTTSGESAEPEVETSPETKETEPPKTELPQVIHVKGARMYKDEVVHKDQPDLFVGGILRQYQVEGLNWLKGLYENGVNGILADEMGLGKTIQCIALVSHLVDEGIPGPFFVCAPLSTVPNWVSEFKRFAPKVPVILYHGTRDERMVLRRRMNRLHTVRRNVSACPVVITSYEITMNDRQYIMNNDWKLLIVDEGHRIKNFQCRLISELKMYRSTHRLLLTGTPLQNNLSELWSLLNFLLPEIFDDLGSFQAWFDLSTLQSSTAHKEIIQEERKNNVLNMLHQILTPFMLRRLKSDIDLRIPPKREMLVYAPLTKKQTEMYKAVANKTIRSLMGCDEEEKQRKEVVKLDKKGRPVRKSCGAVNYAKLLDMETAAEEEEEGDGKKKRTRKASHDGDDDDLDSWVEEVAKQQQIRSLWGQKATTGLDTGPKGAVINIQLRNAMALLRKTCNHPYLIEYPLTESGEYKIDENIVTVSGKFLLLDKMLPELKKRGHKVLIFSQMTSILDVLGDYCYMRDWRFCRLDGSMNITDRRIQIDDFNNDPDIFVFMLSTRAGGLGINLTAADTCIIFDSDWNPQCDLQAQDRCHRIGQTRPVLIFRLVTSNTIDQKIVERAAAKRKLEKMVIHKGQFKKGLELNAKPISIISTQELLNLLKEVDYDEVVDKSVISDSDLKRLLDRSDLLEKMNENKQQMENDKATRNKSRLQKDVAGVFKVIEEDGGSAGEKSGLQSVNAHDTILGPQNRDGSDTRTRDGESLTVKLNGVETPAIASVMGKHSDEQSTLGNNNKSSELDQELK